MKVSSRSVSNWRLFALPLLVALCASCRYGMAQPTLAITSPNSGTVVSPGQSVNVTVTASGGTFELVMLVVQDPRFHANQVLSTPPYQFSLPIPADMPADTYSLVAMGTNAGINAASAPVSIIVQKSGTPTLSVLPTSLRFRFVGDVGPLRVTGTYPDGTRLDVTNSAQTQFISDTPSVATVTGVGGFVTAVGPGSANIVINGILYVPVTVPPPVSVIPTNRFLYSAQTLQFHAHVANGLANQTVNWTVSPAGVGAINSTGSYTAPMSVTSLQAVTITATNSANSAQFASATLWLTPPIVVSVSPASVPLSASQTQKFTASFSNVRIGYNTAVNWTISPAGVGSVNPLGLYTAPGFIGSPQTITITATSSTDASKHGSATINLTP